MHEGKKHMVNAVVYVETYPIVFSSRSTSTQSKSRDKNSARVKREQPGACVLRRCLARDHHTKWVQRKDGVATGAGVRKRQWGLYSWWADLCKRKGRSWLFFRLWTRVLTAFEEKISCGCNFCWFFFAVFPVCGRKSPLTRRYKMLPQTVKKWKVQLQVLQKRQLFFVCLSTSLIFFFVLYIFADFFAFISFSLVFCFMVFLCGAALSFFGLSTSDLEHATGSRPPNMTWPKADPQTYTSNVDARAAVETSC